MMEHNVCFDGVENHWNTALPLGNGKMGGMVFFEQNILHIALNHYDCYYPILTRYGRKKEAEKVTTYQEICKKADQSRIEAVEENIHYNDILNPKTPGSRPTYHTTSFPMAGEILLPLHMDIISNDFSLILHIEQAIVELKAKGLDKEASCKILIPPKADGLLVLLHQSQEGLWGDADIILPSGIGMDKYSIEKGGEVGKPWIRTSFCSEGELDTDNVISFETVVSRSNEALAVSVSGCSQGSSPAFETVNQLLDVAGAYIKEHKDWWEEYWRSSITLPDKFLETLWHLHVYLMGCASGLGSSYPEQACGLNGLWDIRRPSLWGSMWYWDVNIQEAFWPVFSMNHLELGKLFCEGYLSYETDILDYTAKVYETMDELNTQKKWALDYPHTLYHCIQPWCAQYLWHYYDYSGDMDFLRDKAYPVFQKQIAFFKDMAVSDKQGILHIPYDISPEQGTITTDSVVTIASINQLLNYSIKAAHILNRSSKEAEEYTQLLKRLPEYSLTGDGSRLKDSLFAADDLFLRHPSLLMPIFPAQEMSRNSSKQVLEIARNTLKYAKDNTEIGMFGFGWLACSAAKLGDGKEALDILYEKGLDYILHSNGLCYEESERFINYCLITKPPLYPPAMTEPSGGIVMTLNMMVLQSEDYIEVFPAMPPKWQDSRFDCLLAPGGFIVSAEMSAGIINWIQVTATKENSLSLLLPEHFSSSGKSVVYEKDMAERETISFGAPEVCKENHLEKVQTRKAGFTGRRIYLGEHSHTDFHKAVDAFTCPYLMGYTHLYPMTQYVFDFGDGSYAKDYDTVYSKERYQAGKSQVFFGGPISIGIDVYTSHLGFGFASDKGLSIQDRKEPDDMRRDFVEGNADNEFWLELPRGKYNLLVISGDENGHSLTHLMLPNQTAQLPGSIMESGRYQCKTIPFIQEQDGIFKLRFSTEKGYHWKLNALFLNKEYSYC